MTISHIKSGTWGFFHVDLPDAQGMHRWAALQGPMTSQIIPGAGGEQWKKMHSAIRKNHYIFSSYQGIANDSLYMI